MKKLLERAKKQLKAAAIRAFQAATAALIATISGKSLLSEIDWGLTLSIVVLAALTAFVYGVSCKLPECEESIEAEIIKSCNTCKNMGKNTKD